MTEETSRVVLAVEAHSTGHVAGETEGWIHIPITNTVVAATALGTKVMGQSVYQLGPSNSNKIVKANDKFNTSTIKTIVL